ncbi:hypothetical protein G3I40_21420 [Streptomyces sp. SID14478]|uniref:hypothetical protein n=1 Tax=Streptomyces sp. SID14478 TaxID=2706073 RepID=UPI0013D96F93|nr:hypothetical protein [Streptomyces sp. SID14478]NEB77753.1 hypothetical protein [Streptomyces sp. SID14478]
MPAAPPFPTLPDGPEQGRPPSRLRLFGLLAVVVLTAALPLAGASAGPAGDGPARPAAEKAEKAEKAESALTGAADKVDDRAGDKAAAPAGTAGGAAVEESDAVAVGEKSDAAPGRPSSSLLGGPGPATAHCGPQLASPEGIEAQTCVLSQGRDTWARTYYRNTTGAGLTAVLTLMAPGGRTVQISCPVGAEDEPGMCETPRERSRGELSRHAAVAEYASRADSPLLLRSGSNSAPAHGG